MPSTATDITKTIHFKLGRWESNEWHGRQKICFFFARQVIPNLALTYLLSIHQTRNIVIKKVFKWIKNRRANEGAEWKWARTFCGKFCSIKCEIFQEILGEALCFFVEQINRNSFRWLFSGEKFIKQRPWSWLRRWLALWRISIRSLRRWHHAGKINWDIV